MLKGYKRLLALSALLSGASAVEDTATGNPLTFLTDLARPLKSLLIPFTPKQTGSGDPSPSNIRPIVPWEGLTVWNGGKNLYDEATYPLTQGRIIWPGDGTSDANANYAATIDFIPCENIAGKKITLNKRPGGGNPGFAFYTAKTTGSRFAGYTNSGITAGTPWTITVPEGAKYMRFTVPAGATDIQLEAGDTATAYEPYKPITETDIVFPSPVYGGTLDVVSGVLTVTHALLTKNTASMNNSEDYPGWKNSGIEDIIGTGVNELLRNILTNVSPVSNLSVGANTAFSGDVLYLNKSFFNKTQSEWEALAIDIQILIPLATPQEIQLTPQQITALVGNNTIWSDADGDLTVTFLKKG